MKLQTQIPLRKADNQIDYHSQLLLLGSCFSQNIGEKFEYHKFRSLLNPFGIVFHPKAIENLISKSILRETYSENDIFFHNERWHCFDAHSDLSDSSEERLIGRLNEGLKRTYDQIKRATHIIITLGTAWVYRSIESDMIVSNCHKVPQTEFKKELLQINELTRSLKEIVEKIRSVNENTELIFAVSPVRHLKDGFVENQRSKAHLISAVQSLVDSSSMKGSEGETYFPSYEIMMDELRDYRFYDSDMVHPSQLAIDYIWEKFKEVWIAQEAYETMEKVDEVQRGLGHRPFDSDSGQHRIFLKSLEAKIAYLQHEYPFMGF